MGTSHGGDGVRNVVQRVRDGMADLLALAADYEVMLGNGGSTLLWDAAVFGLIERQSSHLVFGGFSSKFAAASAAAPYLEAPQVCETEPGKTPQLLTDIAGDVYAYPHNETSTG